MFTIQLALGGLMGLPFAAAAVGITEQLFPNTEINKNAREMLASLGGDDHEMGSFIADAALKGMATAFSPVDVSGRFGMSAVLGQNPYYGFQAGDLLGAPGSMLENMLKGVTGVASGDPSKIGNFIPNGLQQAFQATQDSGAVRDAQGGLLFQPSETQRMMMAIGFRPKELSDARESQMINTRHQTIANRQLAMWYQTQQAAYQKGDYAAVKQALYDKAQQDPTFSPLVALKRIVAGVQKSTTVQTPLDKGSADQLASREKVAQSFGQPTTAQSQPTQVQQLIQRAEMERQVGIPGAGQVLPAELSKASTMDFLIRHYGVNDVQARTLLQQLGQQKNPKQAMFHPGFDPLAGFRGSESVDQSDQTGQP
jgi:hypothetical protein